MLRVRFPPSHPDTEQKKIENALRSTKKTLCIRLKRAGTNTCILEGVFDRGGGKRAEPVPALLILYSTAIIGERVEADC
jgi:hypothetical protein